MAATWCSSWPRSQCHGEYSRTFCGSSRDCDRRRPQREALNGEACNTTTGEVRRDDEKSVPRNAGSVQIPAFGGSKRVSRWTVLAARAEKAHSERSACKLSGEYRLKRFVIVVSAGFASGHRRTSRAARGNSTASISEGDGRFRLEHALERIRKWGMAYKM